MLLLVAVKYQGLCESPGLLGLGLSNERSVGQELKRNLRASGWGLISQMFLESLDQSKLRDIITFSCNY